MPLENQDLKVLFKHYVEQTASPKEVMLLLEYFGLEKDNPQLLSMILLEMEQPGIDDNIIGLQDEKLFQRVENALQERIMEDSKERNSWRRKIYRITAAVAATLLLTSGLLLWNNSRPEVMTTVYAAYGQQGYVQLPDSSKVWLNSGTTLIYPVDFKGDTRTITLKDGEAFFEVVHQNHPFIIKTHGTNITVLGTSFEITAFEKEKDSKITVSTGKVGVQITGNKQPATFLTPGERADVDKLKQSISKTKVDLADIAVWRQQRLIFEDQPLPEVLQSLERKYNVHITIQNNRLLSERVSMRLGNQPLADVLMAISFSNHFSFRKINEQLVIVK